MRRRLGGQIACGGAGVTAVFEKSAAQQHDCSLRSLLFSTLAPQPQGYHKTDKMVRGAAASIAAVCCPRPQTHVTTLLPARSLQ